MGDPLGGGKFVFTLFVVGIIIVVGMLAMPAANTIIRGVDTTGWRPITQGAMTLLPYGFWGFVLYIALTKWKFGGK